MSGSRRRRLLVGAALLAVVGLAFGATALDDIRISGGGPANEDVPENAPGGGEGNPPAPTSTSDISLSPWYFLAFFGLFVVAALLVGWRRDPRTAAMVLLGGVVLLVLLALLGGPADVAPQNASQGGLPEPQNRSLGGTGPGTPGQSQPPTALPMGVLVLVGLAIAVAAVVGVSRTGEDRTATEPTDEPTPADVEAVGDAAGRAADRLDETGLENAVYRAWVEMTDALDVAKHPSTTPAQFRDRALAAGFPSAAVSELTELFRDVRYGDAPTTPERERAARTALRDIEAAAEELADTAAGEDESPSDGSDGQP